MNRFLCFIGFHKYKIVNKGPVVNTNDQHVGMWTFRECSLCGNCKYKQHVSLWERM